MPAFIAMLLGGLINIAGYLAGRVLIGLGIGVVTYSGFKFGLDALKADAVASLLGLPPNVLDLLGILKVGVCISIVTSAVAARLVINGLSGDTFKRWVLK